MTASSFRAVPYDQMYYRELEKCKEQSLARSGRNFDRKTYISEEAANELRWCIRNISDAFVPIKSPPFDLRIVLEISRCRWNRIENKYHINSLELQAAYFCLKAFWKKKTRLLCCWNWIMQQLLHTSTKKGNNFSHF